MANEQTLSWPPAVEVSHLGPGEVHLWSTWLDQPPEKQRDHWQLLSADEQARAERFYFDKDRRRYITARGTLRCLLGGYLGTPAEQILFTYEAHGKPQLAGTSQEIQFNISHAQQVALLAFCRGTELGVDVEWIRPLSDMDAVAKRSFSIREFADYLRTAPEEKAQSFFNCWTRKEAFIKAIGDGLSYPLGGFDVTLLPGEPARFLAIKGDEETAAQWTLMSLQPAGGYVGALALPGREWQVRRWQFN